MRAGAEIRHHGASLRLIPRSPHPSETFDYDMATRARTLRKKRQEVPSRHDPRGPTSPAGCSPRRPTARRVPIGRLLDAAPTPAARPGSAPALPLRLRVPNGIAPLPAVVPPPILLSLVDRGLCPRHRPCPRRHGEGLGLVHVRQGARRKGEHLQGLHRLRADAASRSATPSAGALVAQGSSAGGMLMGPSPTWRRSSSRESSA